MLESLKGVTIFKIVFKIFKIENNILEAHLYITIVLHLVFFKTTCQNVFALKIIFFSTNIFIYLTSKRPTS
jgi:hypothetical protein